MRPLKLELINVESGASESPKKNRYKPLQSKEEFPKERRPTAGYDESGTWTEPREDTFIEPFSVELWLLLKWRVSSRPARTSRKWIAYLFSYITKHEELLDVIAELRENPDADGV